MPKQCFTVTVREETIHEVTTPPCNSPEEAELVAIEMLEEGEGEVVESTFEAGDVIPIGDAEFDA